MTKLIANGALDAALGYVADRAARLCLCAGAPASAGDALTPIAQGGAMAGTKAVVPGLGRGDLAMIDGPVSGRRLVVATQTHVSVTEDAVADHVALLDAAGTELLLVTTLVTPQTVTAGSTVTLRHFTHDIEQPV